MRDKFLLKWGEIATKHNGWVLLAALVITFITVALASQLTMTSRWSDLLPLKDPMVQEFDKIISDFSSASNSIIVIKGEEDDIKAFAEEIVPRINNSVEDVKWVEYKLNTGFFENHGLMLSKTNDLKDMSDLFSDLGIVRLLAHINDNFEKTYVGSGEKISSKEQEDGAVAFLDGIQFWLQSMENYALNEAAVPEELSAEAVDRLLMGDPYFISQDKDMLLVSVQPDFSITDMEKVVEHVDALQKILDESLEAYPNVEAGMTGVMPLARDEMVYAMEDMSKTSVIAFILVIALFIISFRMWTTPLLAGVNLIIGIIWAAGFGAIFLDSLNIFTQMFAVILIGMGIDYSIHIISIYNEMRYKGEDMTTAMKSTMLKSGAGILTSGLTTASAFFTLMIADSRGMKEMGLMLGVGILACMLSSVFVLPSLLVTREKIAGRIRSKPPKPVNVEFKFLGRIGKNISTRPLMYLGIGLLVTIFFVYQALTVTFDYNYLNMEPKGIPSVTLQDEMIEAFQMSPDFALVTAGSVEEARNLAEKGKDVASISMVSSISDYIPSPAQQEERKPILENMRALLTENQDAEQLDQENFSELIMEIERLEMNVYELGQMAFVGGQDRIDKKCKQLIGDAEDPDSRDYILDLADSFNSNPEKAIAGLRLFQDKYEPLLRKKALNMTNTASITTDDLPAEIINQFYSKSGDRSLITLIPKESVWNLKFLTQFTEQMHRVDPKITGTPIMIFSLINYIAKDGKLATILTLIVVFILLLIDFRKVKLVLLTMIPLIFGAFWMVGLLNTIGKEMTILNVMGIPMIVGIGIDFGVHFMHRYRHEGKGQIPTIIASTGKAILITSLTTMVGFGSLLLAKYRGMGSLGLLLVLGVGACCLTTVMLLPALLGWMEKRKNF